MTLRLGVLASGGGTNLQAILDAAAAGRIDVEVALVVSDRRRAFALERARRAGVEARFVSRRQCGDRAAFEAALVAALRERDVQWVALAGFMRILSERFLDAFPRRVVNIHPSLLPAFPGLEAQRQAFEAGVRVSGCTVHFVDEGTDSGPIIAQAAVPVLPDDDVERLSARILRQEHRLYPEVLGAIARKQIAWEPDGARIAAPAAPSDDALCSLVLAPAAD